MAVTLVTGGTGHLGRLVVAGLQRQGAPFRVLTRDRAAAGALFGDGVPLAVGDFTDPASLDAALAGVDQLFLLSPITPSMATGQIAAIDAARRGGIGRILKLSGSDWTIDPPGRSISGDAHGAIERHLQAAGITGLALRPNAWAQVSLAPLVAQLKRGVGFTSSRAAATVAYIDARDIADVAVSLLAAADWPAGPLVLTGPRPLGDVDLADIAATVTRRPVRPIQISLEAQAEQVRAAGLDAFKQRYLAEFMALIRSGAAAGVTDVVSRLLGRPARDVAAFLAEQLSPPGVEVQAVASAPTR